VFGPIVTDEEHLMAAALIEGWARRLAETLIGVFRF